MSKRTKQNSRLPKKGKKAREISNREDWEVVSTGGFSPTWKPEKAGEDVIFIPLSARILPPRKKMKESAMVECELTGGSSDNFYSKDVMKGVAIGERFTIPLSYNLLGEDKLGIHEKKKASLSKVSLWLLSQRKSMRIVFDGKIKGGQGSVKLFTIMLPSGVREAMAGSKKR